MNTHTFCIYFKKNLKPFKTSCNLSKYMYPDMIVSKSIQQGFSVKVIATQVNDVSHTLFVIYFAYILIYYKYFIVLDVKSVWSFWILQTYYIMSLITSIINQLYKPSSWYQIGMNLIDWYIKNVIIIIVLINGTLIQISDYDCYMLVSKDKAIWLTTKSTSAKLTTLRTTTDESLFS